MSLLSTDIGNINGDMAPIRNVINARHLRFARAKLAGR